MKRTKTTLKKRKEANKNRNPGIGWWFKFSKKLLQKQGAEVLPNGKRKFICSFVIWILFFQLEKKLHRKNARIEHRKWILLIKWSHMKVEFFFYFNFIYKNSQAKMAIFTYLPILMIEINGQNRNWLEILVAKLVSFSIPIELFYDFILFFSDIFIISKIQIRVRMKGINNRMIIFNK